MSDIAAATGWCALFVGSMYAWEEPRRLFVAITDLERASMDPALQYDRDADRNIQRRIISLVAVSGAALIHLATTGYPFRMPALSSTFQSTFQGLTATGVLFLGVAASHAVGVVGGVAPRHLVESPSTWQFLRNFVLCPFAEEFFFRRLIMESVLRGDRSRGSKIVISALVFSVAHIHHIMQYAVMHYRRGRMIICDGEGDEDAQQKARRQLIRDSWKQAALGVTIHSVIAASFGLLSGYLYEYECKRSVIATAFAHSLCNLLGAPTVEHIRPRDAPVASMIVVASYLVGTFAFVARARRLISSAS